MCYCYQGNGCKLFEFFFFFAWCPTEFELARSAETGLSGKVGWTFLPGERLAEQPSREGPKTGVCLGKVGWTFLLGQAKTGLSSKVGWTSLSGWAKNRCLSGKDWLNIPPVGHAISHKILCCLGNHGGTLSEQCKGTPKLIAPTAGIVTVCCYMSVCKSSLVLPKTQMIIYRSNCSHFPESRRLLTATHLDWLYMALTRNNSALSVPSVSSLPFACTD